MDGYYSYDDLYKIFCEKGIPDQLKGFGTAGLNMADMIMCKEKLIEKGYNPDWQQCFGRKLAAAITSAVNVASGYEPAPGSVEKCLTSAVKARNWFISSYPLLGALASTFKIVEDPAVCARMDISVAAVNAEMKEIYINPAAGLIEEIRALSHPPIPWDVDLARWFDNYFFPLERVRSYARPSRRQSSSPDIPRPRHIPANGAEDGRTFGVVLDTSGSMNRTLLAKALGAIASYSMSRDVPAVRLVFCDAAAYDQGYVTPESMAEKVKGER